MKYMIYLSFYNIYDFFILNFTDNCKILSYSPKLKKNKICRDDQKKGI